MEEQRGQLRKQHEAQQLLRDQLQRQQQAQQLGAGAAPLQPPAPLVLPLGWREELDASTGRYFYISPANAVSWAPPPQQPQQQLSTPQLQYGSPSTPLSHHRPPPQDTPPSITLMKRELAGLERQYLTASGAGGDLGKAMVLAGVIGEKKEELKDREKKRQKTIQ